MKKILILITCVFIFFEKNIYNTQAEDKINLDFETISDSKFIYCNNPEVIRKDNLADTTYNSKPELLMQENIKPGDYKLFISLRNMIDKINLLKKNQERVYVDVEFYNKNINQDLVIKINKLGYQIPESAMQLNPVSEFINNKSWSCLNAYSNYLQKKFDRLDYLVDDFNKNNFITHEPKALPDIYKNNLIIKPLEKFWLLGDAYESRPGMLVGQVFLLLNNFKVISGEGVIKIAAFVDINNYNDNNISPGKYKTKIIGNEKSFRYYKGIADSSDIVQTDLEYDIDNNTGQDIYLPVEIKNDFTNNNYELANSWITNLNPYTNPDLAWKTADNDMFEFRYFDENGSWYFDKFHTDYPNQLADISYNKSYCNLGNWGMTNRYNITINNASDYDKHLVYYIKSDSDIIIESENIIKIKSGLGQNYNNSFDDDPKEDLYESDYNYAFDNENEKLEAYRSDLRDKKLRFNNPKDGTQKILEFIIPARQIKKISFDVTLCTNCCGGLENSLRLFHE